MTEAETLRFLRKQFKRWIYMVAHYGWKVTTNYYSGSDDMPPDANADCVAYTQSKFHYLEAVIHVNLRKAQDLNKHDMEYVAIHELVHLLVSPMQDGDAEVPTEYTVTTIARILQGLGSDALHTQPEEAA